jgi:tetratricopeptide (TPR) repeat protein
LREYADDLSGALQCHQQALSKAIHREKAETLIYLGLVYNNRKQYTEALQAYSQALQWLENEKKRDLTMIARCLVGLGNVQWARRELGEALGFAKRALAIRENEIKPKNDFEIAACLGNIGNILHHQGDMQGALSYATRAVDLLSACGKDDPRLAAALNNLGAMYQSTGDSVKAREYFERALKSLPDENHSHRKSTMANIARLDSDKNSTK